ncbi:unnamed protein product, partial [Toxocara canis]|uniref:RRM domain-containing protein n=1 Tax=Toxocara canis TaxID=6265 RepID=A0A183U4I3_TOXCA
MSEAHPNERTCYVTGIHDKVTKPLLEELFIQMGPLEKVVRVHRYALIIFNDEESVPFAVECMDGIRMFGLELSVRPKKGTKQVIFLHFLKGGVGGGRGGGGEEQEMGGGGGG